MVGNGITGRTVARIVKGRAKLAGFDPSEFGAHSLRAGFITEGATRGLPLAELMELSGHKTPAVAMGYYRGGAALHSRAGRLVGGGGPQLGAGG